MINDSIKENINKLTQIDEKRGKELNAAYDKFNKRVRKECEKAENAAKKDHTYLLNQKLKQKIGKLNECAGSLQVHSQEIAFSALELAQQLEDIKSNIESLIKKSKQNLGGFENG